MPRAYPFTDGQGGLGIVIPAQFEIHLIKLVVDGVCHSRL